MATARLDSQRRCLRWFLSSVSENIRLGSYKISVIDAILKLDYLSLLAQGGIHMSFTKKYRLALIKHLAYPDGTYPPDKFALPRSASDNELPRHRFRNYDFICSLSF